MDRAAGLRMLIPTSSTATAARPNGDFRGTTRDGARLDLRGCDLWTFRDGKVVRKNSFWKIVTDSR